MSKFTKAFALAVCAATCFLTYVLVVGGLNQTQVKNDLAIKEMLNSSPKHIFELPPSMLNLYPPQSPLWELLSIFLFGAIICLVFGTPCLLIIDKYFSRFKTRYLTGGFVASWIAWLVMTGPLFTPRFWFTPWYWVQDGINYVGTYVWLGFCTGLLFTGLLWISEKLKK